MFASKNDFFWKYVLGELWTTPLNNTYQKIVNFTVLRNVVLMPSKIIRHFENSQLILTWHKMASVCAKFHCHTISSLENTKVGHFCPPHPHPIKYATPDTPNKIGLRKGVLKICSKFTEEHQYRSSISIKLLCSFIEIILRQGFFSCKFSALWPNLK